MDKKMTLDTLKMKRHEGQILGWYDGEKQICPLCMKEMDPTHCQMAEMHLECAGSEMPVWRVSLDGMEGGYVVRDFTDIISLVIEMEGGMDIGDAYTIHRETVNAASYFHMGEFQGS